LEAEGRDKKEILETIGLSLYVAGQSERAEPVFRQAIAENPPRDQSAAYHYYLASALAMSEKTEEAVRYARRAAALRTNSARFQGRIPWILYHAKHYDQAEEEYLRLLEKFDNKYDSPGDREALHDARLILSNICVLQDRVPEAEEWLEQVLDEFPEDIAALNDLGYLWADQGKHLHRALRMVRLAVEGDPENEAYRDSLGWAHFRLGQYEDAVRELERAANVDDPDGIILDHLGDAYLETNDTEKALATWRRAAEVFRSQKETKYLEKTEAKIKKHTDG
jgi:tetratricopeptide (TPR) repeat protein